MFTKDHLLVEQLRAVLPPFELHEDQPVAADGNFVIAWGEIDIPDSALVLSVRLHRLDLEFRDVRPVSILTALLSQRPVPPRFC
jgi:hypothetical protein